MRIAKLGVLCFLLGYSRFGEGLDKDRLLITGEDEFSTFVPAHRLKYSGSAIQQLYLASQDLVDACFEAETAPSDGKKYLLLVNKRGCCLSEKLKTAESHGYEGILVESDNEFRDEGLASLASTVSRNILIIQSEAVQLIKQHRVTEVYFQRKRGSVIQEWPDSRFPVNTSVLLNVLGVFLNVFIYKYLRWSVLKELFLLARVILFRRRNGGEAEDFFNNELRRLEQAMLEDEMGGNLRLRDQPQDQIRDEWQFPDGGYNDHMNRRDECDDLMAKVTEENQCICEECEQNLVVGQEAYFLTCGHGFCVRCGDKRFFTEGVDYCKRCHRRVLPSNRV